MDAIKSYQVVLIVGETGSGKSTQVIDKSKIFQSFVNLCKFSAFRCLSLFWKTLKCVKLNAESFVRSLDASQRLPYPNDAPTNEAKNWGRRSDIRLDWKKRTKFAWIFFFLLQIFRICVGFFIGHRRRRC